MRDVCDFHTLAIELLLQSVIHLISGSCYNRSMSCSNTLRSDGRRRVVGQGWVAAMQALHDFPHTVHP